MKLIRENFGVPIETHSIFWDEETNIIVTSGIEFTDEVLQELNNNYSNLKKMRDEINSKYISNKSEIVEVDFSDMIEQSKQPRETNTQSSQPQMVTRGRRGKNFKDN